MKKNKGFTLIELLAVIVILAIIALIAVPVVMNIIGKANKAAFKDSAYAIIKAGEYFYTDQLLLNAGLAKDKTFTFPNDIEGLEIKGSKPSEGYVTVNKKGQVEMAISNGKYCVTKGFQEDDVTISDGTCELSKEEETNEVYYNPNKAELCTKKEWENNADKNGKSGCMRWYIYGEEGNKQKLILDHNTTNMVAWNDTGENLDDYVTLKTQLTADTTNWKIKADIITIEEVVNLLPYYQNLSDTEKDLFLNPTEENTSVIDGYHDYLNTFFGEMCSRSENAAICESGDFIALFELLAAQPNSPHLPSYMFMDMILACSTGEDCPTYGYWTKTAHALVSYDAWLVNSYGYVVSVDVGSVDVGSVAPGLRPVITLSK